MKYTKLMDQILGTIIENSHFNLMEVCQCFKRLDRSLDRLLDAIEKAQEKGWSLSRVTYLMIFEGIGN